ncbi:MAG: DUF4173 domain-containing protein [Ruminococcaceae bacterium]|nr:DUF4173 domain-containing protein [Oscillospiraceae bacterium]
MNNTPEFNDIANSVPYYYEEKNKYNYTLTHGIYALLAFVIGTLWFRWVFSYNPNDIFGVYQALPITLFALVFVLYTVSYFRLRKAHIGHDSCVLLAALLIFSLRFTIYPTDTWSFISVLAQFVLHVTALLFVFSVGKEGTIDRIGGSIAKALFVAPYASFHRIFTSLSVFFRLKKKDGETSKKRKKALTEAGLIGIGLFIAVPIVVNVLVLLGSDGFFADFVDGIFRFLDGLSFDFHIGNYVNIISVLVSMFIFGAMFSADKIREEAPPAPIDCKVVPETIGKTVLAVLLAVYALFIVAQIDGFSHMIMGVLPDSVTYAEFARSGFFELCAVACINGAILYFYEIFSKKNDPEKRFGIMKLLIICFTIFLILTAAVKMLMYISAYGFTPKRFYTLWFMVLLTVLFLMTIFKLRDGNFKLSRCSVYLTLIWLSVLFLVDFEGLSTALNNGYFTII